MVRLASTLVSGIARQSGPLLSKQDSQSAERAKALGRLIYADWKRHRAQLLAAEQVLNTSPENSLIALKERAFEISVE